MLRLKMTNMSTRALIGLDGCKQPLILGGRYP
jgi:hypothetical protein